MKTLNYTLLAGIALYSGGIGHIAGAHQYDEDAARPCQRGEPAGSPRGVRSAPAPRGRRAIRDVRPGMFCPQDARICPDGSAVIRIGPDCRFAPCRK